MSVFAAEPCAECKGVHFYGPEGVNRLWHAARLYQNVILTLDDDGRPEQRFEGEWIAVPRVLIDKLADAVEALASEHKGEDA